jgi:hypothetical protein
VIAADLSATDLDRFLREQRITPASAAYLFTKRGEVIASSGLVPISREKPQVGQTSVALPRVGDLDDPVLTRLATSYKDGRMSGSSVFDVDDRAYIGRVIEMPPQFGRDQLLAIIVPIDEIEKNRSRSFAIRRCSILWLFSSSPYRSIDLGHRLDRPASQGSFSMARVQR